MVSHFNVLVFYVNAICFPLHVFHEAEAVFYKIVHPILHKQTAFAFTACREKKCKQNTFKK